MRGQISLLRIWAAWAAGAGLLAGYAAFGQHSGTDRLVITIEGQLAGQRGRHEASAEPGDQPLKFRSAVYDPVGSRRLIAAAMPPSVVSGSGADRRQSVYAYVAGGGWPSLLYQAEGEGKWREIANIPKSVNSAGSLSGAFAYLDRSGRESLLVAGIEGVALYRNDSRNSFSDVTRRSGLRSAPGVIYTSAAFGDLDGDGLPDLLVTAYADLNHPPSKPVFTFPNDFPGAASQLYRNNGDGTFTDITESTGLDKNLGRARKAILADLDGDGRLDILLLRDNKPPALYLNRGGWKFDDATWDAGDDLSAYAFFEGAVSDFNGDGKPDLALWATHIFRILVNDGKAAFEPIEKVRMPDPATSLFGFRGIVADIDGNGSDDVITVDRDRRLRAFANQPGAFREIPLELPDGLSESYLAAVRSGASPSLVAVRLDGSIVLLKTCVSHD